MSDIKGIFSLRIVVADYYQSRPTNGLDPSYSNFRGHQIISLPVIRIFGSNAKGKKACMHIHGVFPYFYIPYDESELGNVEQFSYQIAINLDKALNISLGQASSQNQHVFKVQPVKGIPFYGYHSKEHQYLKVYLYNPRFIRRAANLFQNGAILGRIFQPHESHVPYILQFSIDFNLYGMSFLHVPQEVVKFRHDVDTVPCTYVSENQSVPERIAKISTCEIEVDIGSAFILNRYQLSTRSSEHSNPGIQAIWQDERLRRRNLEEDNIPLEIQKSLGRTDVVPTESDLFYRSALVNKVKDLSVDETLNNSIGTPSSHETLVSAAHKRRKYNLSSLFTNSVYPGVCSQESEFLKASAIPDNLSAETFFENSTTEAVSPNLTLRGKFHDSNWVDEDMVLSLSQPSKFNQTLQGQDFDILEVMRKLEEGENDVDLDSTLAPLSAKDFSPHMIHNEVDSNEADNSLNSDGENEDGQDFTLALQDINSFTATALPTDESIPQTDGAFDFCTPKKTGQKDTITSPRSQARKSQKKYVPLDIKLTKKLSSSDKNSVPNESSPQQKCTSQTEDFESLKHNLKKVFVLLREEKNNNLNPKNLKQNITINLSGSLKENDASSGNNITKKSEKTNNASRSSIATSNSKQSKNGLLAGRVTRGALKKVIKTQTRACRVRLKKLTESEIKRFTKNYETKIGTKRSRSRTDISRAYDKQNNFFPEAGPSHINYYELIELPNPPLVVRDKTFKQRSAKNTQIHTTENMEEDLNINSFYEGSFVVDSPSIFNASESLAVCPTETYKNVIKSIAMTCANSVLITPKELPPDRHEIKKETIELSFSNGLNGRPFYGDSSDMTSKREIGHKILHIPGNSLNDCPEFTPAIKNLVGLTTLRKNIFTAIAGENNDLKTADKIKEYFSDEKRNVITTFESPPTRNEVVLWLKTRKDLKSYNEENSQTNEFYSNNENVIKMVEEKPTSIEMEPEIVYGSQSYNVQKNSSFFNLTPDNSKLRETATASKRQRTRRSARARLSVLKRCEINRINPIEKIDLCSDSSSNGSINETLVAQNSPDTGLQINHKNEENSRMETETPMDSIICSKTVMKALEGLSFLKKTSSEMQGNSSSCSYDNSYGISGPTLNNTYAFKLSLENLEKVKVDLEFNYLTVLSVEVFVSTRNDLKPNPEFDAIDCVFYSVTNNVPENHNRAQSDTGYLSVISPGLLPNQYTGVSVKCLHVEDEQQLFDQIIKLFSYWDPDILVGYEIEMNSWGYLIDRAKVLGINLVQLLSRVPTQKIRESSEEEREDFSDFDFEMKVCGRIILDCWKLMRSEIALTSYTFENIVYHILHRRVPLYSHRDLTAWYKQIQTRWIVLEFYLERVKGTLQLLKQLDIIGRTSELAKLFGIQFYEVLSRGSQFRVESMMLRIAKPQNLVALSPSVQQRAHMRAPEYLPLILEPESRMYTDPVIVLDFQSLYPSVIIAYNYCFSTCLGRVEHLGQSTHFEFGASQLRISPNMLRNLINRNLITSSPCGVIFVKKEVRRGVLPTMLNEILDTRLMVKQSMKLHKENSVLHRVLHSRQLGLKLIANVTYGYTAANFSGRMPSVEVGDSVVAKGRETLERAIKMVENNEKWRCKVVYGDTDSLFVLVPGRSKEESFKIGAEIAEKITADNPAPIKLKLEKVYQPCILQTKKRYVGYMYETPNQIDPIYEAKGIETVRRDGCPAVAKMLEKCIRILFETRNVSKVKFYVNSQFTKLLTGKANLQDLIFAKEFRGKSGYKPGACVPALELTKKWMLVDPRNEPRRGERVPFVIVNGPPAVPLIRLVRSPNEVLSDDGLKINAIYYITKAIIPPLNRCLLLIGADVNEWFADLPRKNLITPALSTAGEIIANHNFSRQNKKSTISQYFSSANCATDCGRHTQTGICQNCKKEVDKSVFYIENKIAKIERNYYLTKKVCDSCCGRQFATTCYSLDCPVLFALKVKERQTKQIEYLKHLLNDCFL